MVVYLVNEMSHQFQDLGVDDKGPWFAGTVAPTWDIFPGVVGFQYLIVSHMCSGDEVSAWRDETLLSQPRPVTDNLEFADDLRFCTRS